MKLIQNVGVSALLLSVVSAFLVAGPARCSTYNVTSLADDGGPGELRAAISAANANAGSTITFQSGLSGTITLSPTLQALPTILVPTTIQGPGESLIAVDGRGTYRPFEINAPGASVALSGLTIQNGADAGGTGGGGILLDAGDLALSDCTLSGNTATGNGGGLSNYGTATITHCTFSNNHGYNGGGIYNYTYSGNGGLTTLTGCTLTGNSATINGGGVYDYTYSGTGGNTTLTRTTLSKNSAGGNGAGIYNYSYSGSGGNAVLTNCVVTKNSGIYGGGIYDYTETGSGGTAILTACTVAGNSGSYTGGIYNYTYSGSGGTATLTDCILYGDAGGELFGSVFPVYSDIQGGYVGRGNINADPLFVSPTDLHLKRGSPCLGAGTSVGAPSTDFDGTMRPNPPSIGAYEMVGHTHLLWNNSDGRVMLWSVAQDGTFAVNGFGPYTDDYVSRDPNNKWSATALATGSDGKSHILWNNTDGRVMLWTVDDAGNFTYAGYGPYTDDSVGSDPSVNKWHATAVSVGPDNIVHLLWNNTDHRVMLWNVDSNFNFTLAGYGPYTDTSVSSDPGNLWSATALATGPDNVSRIAWNNVDGRVMLWDVDQSFNFTLAGYGPYTDGAPSNKWSAVGVSVGPDNLTHLLWSNTDRRAMFWNVDSSFNFTLAGYGPYTDNGTNNLWSASALATGPDGLSHILWGNTDYRAMLWGVDNAFNFSVAGYGPYTDNGANNLWSATAVSAGP